MLQDFCFAANVGCQEAVKNLQQGLGFGTAEMPTLASNPLTRFVRADRCPMPEQLNCRGKQTIHSDSP